MCEDGQVVVIGAGFIGFSGACDLMRNGCRRLLVPEEEDSRVTGSSARAKGGFRQQFSTSRQLSVPVFETFHREFRTDISLRQHGYLFPTSTDSDRQGLVSNLELRKAHNVPGQWLETGELQKRFPFRGSCDLRGAVCCGKHGFAGS